MRKKNKSRGLRNNNPGNIRINSDHFVGEIKSSDKEFKQFTTMEHGYRAMFKILKNYIERYGLTTITEIISRWAPATENHTNNYILIVSERSGIKANETVYAWNREMMIRIVAAMSYVENGEDADMVEVIGGWEML